MIDQLQHIGQSCFGILPEIVLVLGLILLLVTDLILHKKENKNLVFGLTTVILLLTFYAWQQQGIYQQTVFLYCKMLFYDTKAHLIKGFVLLTGFFVLVHNRIFKYDFKAEWFVIFLALLLGLSLLSMSVNLTMIFLSLELSSITSYILVAWNKEKRNVEAGIKYLIFGASTSAIMLYGISLLYGMTGTMDITAEAFSQHLAIQQNWVVLVVLLFAFGGLLFKIGLVPFHTWVPDVYESTPIPLVAFLSTAPKIVALFVLLRLTSHLQINIQNLLIILVMASLTIGNLSALWQNSFKRMLAYSSIAHAGFLLVGVLAFNELGVKSALFYAITYIFMNWGAFVGAEILEKITGSDKIDTFAGLGREYLWLGIFVLILMIGLVGLPPTVGFTGKWLIFSALWESYSTSGNTMTLILLVFALLNAAVSLAYYLKLPYYLFLKNQQSAIDNQQSAILNSQSYIWLALFVFLTILLFFKPEIVLSLI